MFHDKKSDEMYGHSVICQLKQLAVHARLPI